MKRILITGSSGVIGRHLAARLMAEGHSLTLAVRDPGAKNLAVFSQQSTPRLAIARVDDISGRTEWRRALEGCATVIHLAALTPGPGVADSAFHTVHDEGTARLCAHSAEEGVKLLVMMSSILALVDNSSDEVIDDTTASQATSAYGRSKLAAERHVEAFARDGRAGVSLRPPLVYGAAAKGNWRLLQRIAASGLPLPFGAVGNRRSLISMDNLVDAVARVVRMESQPLPSAAFAVADAEVVSLADMLGLLREGMGLSRRLYAVPQAALSAPLALVGRARVAQSLFGRLEVDARRFGRLYDWSPVETAQAAIRRSGAEFVSAGKS